MPCNCYWCHKYMEHPEFDHWVIPGIRAGVICYGCGGHFEVWKSELWWYNKIKNWYIDKRN